MAVIISCSLKIVFPSDLLSSDITFFLHIKKSIWLAFHHIQPISVWSEILRLCPWFRKGVDSFFNLSNYFSLSSMFWLSQLLLILLSISSKRFWRSDSCLRNSFALRAAKEIVMLLISILISSHLSLLSTMLAYFSLMIG